MIKRSTVIACGGFDEGFDRPGYEDPLLWLKAREQGEFTYVDRALAYYRHAPELERMTRYAPGLVVFRDRVRQHFGVAGEVRIQSLLAGHVAVLSSERLAAMATGDKLRARVKFREVLQLYSRHARALARLVRTRLPLLIADALSSRRRRALWRRGVQPRLRWTERV